MRRYTIAGLVIALLVALSLIGVASAHAELVSSTPAADAKLTAAPSTVTLVFSEEISDKPAESFFTVADAQGAEVGKGQLDTNDLDHKTLSGALKSGLGDGVYTVTWQTITVDDNGKSSGTFKFGVNVAPSAQATATAAPAAAATTAATAAPAAAAPTATASANPPSTLPRTAGDTSNGSIYLLLAATVLLAAAALLLGMRRAS